jgi:DGQHR domain-containing protein
MFCASCGLKITSNYHETELGKICESCWNDPNLFFPEKMNKSQEWKSISEFLKAPNITEEKIILPVIRLRQKGVTLFSGKLQAKNLLRLYAIFGFEEESLRGYQREIYENQIKDLTQYLLECPIAVMPGLFISIREDVNFTPVGDNPEFKDMGQLEIPLKRGVIWIIDGQHRIGGFEKVFTNFGHLSNDVSKTEEFTKLMNYEIPVTFIASKEAIDLINDKEKIKLKPEDIERLAFFIINKTQRRLSPSLTDALQYAIKRGGVNGIPVIERENWRTDATSIIIDLNSREDSPFYNKVNISGRSGLNKPIQLNSFVSSLKPLFSEDKFISLSENDKKIILIDYWNEIKTHYNDAFSDKNYRNYIILNALGIYTFNILFVDYIKSCLENKLEFTNKINISNYVKKMSTFDWSKSNSKVSAFGGMKGVKEARKLILENIKNNDLKNGGN